MGTAVVGALTRRKLLNMLMITDVIFAVATIAAAAGTIPEFQIRVGCVGAAADGAAVDIGHIFLI